MKIGTQNEYLSHHMQYAEFFQMAHNAGFETVDFCLFSPEEIDRYQNCTLSEIERYYGEIGRMAKDAGIEIYQTHTPFPTHSPNGAAEKERKQLDLQKRAILATMALDCKYTVIHPRGRIGNKNGAMHPEVKEINMQFFGALEDTLRDCDVTCCIENMFYYDRENDRFGMTRCSRPEEIVEYIETLGGDRFAACLDTGHGLLVGDSPARMVRVLGRHLKALHVHDNHRGKDEHLMPFFGVCDWADFASALREVGFEGSISLEADNTIRFERFTEVMPETLAFMSSVADKIRQMAK